MLVQGVYILKRYIVLAVLFGWEGKQQNQNPFEVIIYLMHLGVGKCLKMPCK